MHPPAASELIRCSVLPGFKAVVGPGQSATCSANQTITPVPGPNGEIEIQMNRYSNVQFPHPNLQVPTDLTCDVVHAVKFVI